MHRRTLLAGASSVLLAAPAIAAAPDARVLRMVPQANLTVLDPIWTTAGVTRNHGYMVYDTLYGRDAAFRAQPQMAAGHIVEDGGKRITITLRDGLAFHDGTPVLARDAVASIRRWMKRNPYGQKLDTLTDAIDAPSDKTIVFRLNRPFLHLPDALSSIGLPCFILPERLALTDSFKQITDPTGSGPFRFKRDEFNSGSLAVYERNSAYVPRPDGATSLTAGPKRAFFDRVEWQIIADSATATAALMQGEIDWFELPTPDQQQLLARDKGVVLDLLDDKPLMSFLRLNFLHPPFDDVRVRRALLPAIDQADFMSAVAGADPTNFVTGVGVFPPGTSMATSAGLDVLTRPRDIAEAKRLLRDTDYRSHRMRLLGPSDFPAVLAAAQVAADVFQRLGFDLDFALSDWGTVIQRRVSREPVEKGGWSAANSTLQSFDMADPSTNPLIRGNGLAAYPGWPSVPRLEELRDSWFDAPSLRARQEICAEIQKIALDEVTVIPTGAYYSRTAFRRNLTGRLPGFAIFWNLRRA